MAPQLAPGAAAEPSPEVTSGAEGNWTFNPVRPNAGTGRAQEQGAGSATQRPDSSSPMNVSWLGLGGHPGPGQVNLNLTQAGVVAIVGSDQLRKEREADGERRRSEHRGSWIASSFERWRSAIENYVSSVKPGNQTALNTAAVPFASYLNAMHNRIHPLFAESFLESLDNLPASHPMNDQHLVTRLEIVLTKDGHVQKMGIVRTSGITAFDIAALDAVQRASPYGPAPTAIVSPDGNVYLHWEFHRDEVYACSTMNARPFLLNVPSKGPDPDPTLPPGSAPPPVQERGVPGGSNESREGLLTPPCAASSGESPQGERGRGVEPNQARLPAARARRMTDAPNPTGLRPSRLAPSGRARRRRRRLHLRNLGWILRAIGLSAVAATILGVIVVPGLHGSASDAVVNTWDRASSVFAYAMAILVSGGIVLSIVELVGSHRAETISGALIVAGSSLVVVLLVVSVARAYVAPDTPPQLQVTLLVAVIASAVATTAGWRAIGGPHTRALSLVVSSFALAALVRLAAWEMATLGGERASASLYAVSRGLSTLGVMVEAFGQLAAAVWIGTRGPAGLAALVARGDRGVRRDVGRGVRRRGGRAGVGRGAAHVARPGVGAAGAVCAQRGALLPRRCRRASSSAAACARSSARSAGDRRSRPAFALALVSRGRSTRRCGRSRSSPRRSGRSWPRSTTGSSGRAFRSRASPSAPCLGRMSARTTGPSGLRGWSRQVASVKYRPPCPTSASPTASEASSVKATVRDSVAEVRAPVAEVTSSPRAWRRSCSVR